MDSFKFIKTAITLTSKSDRMISLIPEDITIEQDMLRLMLFMFQEPDITVAYFSAYSEPFIPPLKAAIDRGDMFLLESENFYYRDPRHGRGFVAITPSIMETTNLPRWKQKLIEESTTFVRSILALSERKKREFENWLKIAEEEIIPEGHLKGTYQYDVFLSYSERDRSIALPISHELQAGGARIFMAQKSTTARLDFSEEKKRALHEAEEVWVILSPNSLNCGWVDAEWGAAWVLGKNIVLILNGCNASQIPLMFGRFHCVDASYVNALIKERLVSFRTAPENRKKAPR
jgi:hypothetical protein